ncbi:hypothetical protein MAR_027013 [Mya arenaria]|uniref:H-type lectin domain-containing protein n=1 Tax=Mya arenaria TaxID=6604 RepID=A0ABY7EWC2_MYAAR|nr:uncharacterized protein LOC128244846 [Mya arenaria]WAR12833.1 hypothetical protein MAR_027013 [Mya arenaria]
MRTLKLMLCAIFVQAVWCVPKSSITDSIYQVLSSKIDTINLELAVIRNEQVQTKQDLIQAKTELKRIEADQSFDVPNNTAGESLFDALGNASTSDVINYLRKAFQSEKAHHKQPLGQIKADVAFMWSDLNTLKATVATLNDTQGNLTRDVFEVGRDVEYDIKTVNDTLARIHSMAEWLDTSFTSLNGTQQQTNETVSLLNNDVNLLKSSLMNTSQQEEMTNLRETVSEIQTSLEEKCQSGEIGPLVRPLYPVTLTINFRPAFNSKPAIVYGLKVLDSAHNTNVRVDGHITEMTSAFFKFKIRSWADTVMYGAKFSWMACPKTDT